MLIDQSAYTNRWRQANPAAKALFCCSGMLAAFVATSPWQAGVVVFSMTLVTLLGAGIPLGRYLRAAAPALLFLGISCLTLLISVDSSFSISLTSDGREQAIQLSGRAFASLASLLFLALTTPMTEIIALLRSLKVPDILLDMAVLGYRMLFVFSEAAHQIRTAQAARLGYAGYGHALRSTGHLAAAVALQVWQRATALDLAAQARCSDGTLRFLAPVYPHTGRDLAVALSGAICLISLTLALP